MLRLNRTPKIRVSNRLALVAAALLVTSTLAGVGGSMSDTINPVAETSTPSFALAESSAPKPAAASHFQKKRFKVSLMLLRFN